MTRDELDNKVEKIVKGWVDSPAIVWLSISDITKEINDPNIKSSHVRMSAIRLSKKDGFQYWK